jgi:hypothetical protein
MVTFRRLQQLDNIILQHYLPYSKLPVIQYPTYRILIQEENNSNKIYRFQKVSIT